MVSLLFIYSLYFLQESSFLLLYMYVNVLFTVSCELLNSKNILYNMINQRRDQILLDSKEEKMIFIILNGNAICLKIMDNNVNTITIRENQSLCYLKNSYVVTEMTPLVEAPEREPDPADD